MNKQKKRSCDVTKGAFHSQCVFPLTIQPIRGQNRSELRLPSLFTNISRNFFFPFRFFCNVFLWQPKVLPLPLTLKRKNLGPTVWRSSRKPICSSQLQHAFLPSVLLFVCFFCLSSHLLFAFDPSHLSAPAPTDTLAEQLYTRFNVRTVSFSSSFYLLLEHFVLRLAVNTDHLAAPCLVSLFTI